MIIIAFVLTFVTEAVTLRVASVNSGWYFDMKASLLAFADLANAQDNNVTYDVKNFDLCHPGQFFYLQKRWKQYYEPERLEYQETCDEPWEQTLERVVKEDFDVIVQFIPQIHVDQTEVDNYNKTAKIPALSREGFYKFAEKNAIPHISWIPEYHLKMVRENYKWVADPGFLRGPERQQYEGILQELYKNGARSIGIIHEYKQADCEGLKKIYDEALGYESILHKFDSCWDYHNGNCADALQSFGSTDDCDAWQLERQEKFPNFAEDKTNTDVVLIQGQHRIADKYTEKIFDHKIEFKSIVRQRTILKKTKKNAFELHFNVWNPVAHKGTNTLSERGSSSAFFKPENESEDSIDRFFDHYAQEHRYVREDLEEGTPKDSIFRTNHFANYAVIWKYLYTINAIAIRICKKDESRCSRHMINAGLRTISEPSTFGQIRQNKYGYNDNFDAPMDQIRFGKLSNESIVFPLTDKSPSATLVYPTPKFVDRECYPNCSACKNADTCEMVETFSWFNILLGFPVIILFFLVLTFFWLPTKAFEMAFKTISNLILAMGSACSIYTVLDIKEHYRSFSDTVMVVFVVFGSIDGMYNMFEFLRNMFASMNIKIFNEVVAGTYIHVGLGCVDLTNLGLGLYILSKSDDVLVTEAIPIFFDLLVNGFEAVVCFSAVWDGILKQVDKKITAIDMDEYEN